MKKYLKLITLLVSFLEIICILFHTTIECYASDASFSPILSRDGQFSSRRAICMLPDSHGYLWIGTLDGLLRYNGTDVKNYNRSVLHTESSSISCIFEDSDNNIWIGTEGGLSVYVRENDEFVKVDTPESSDIKIDAKVGCIQQDHDGLIWFSLKAKGIWSYNPESGVFRNYLYDPASGAPSPKINSFIIDCNGSFIISVYCRGLLLCRNDFSSIENLTVRGYDFAEDNFSQMIVGDRNCVYATSANYGLCELFPYTSKANVLVGLNPSVHSTGLCMDDYSRTLYMSTSKGLYSINLNTNNIVHYTKSNTSGLPTDNCYCLALDGNGGLIVGARTGNLFYSSLKKTLWTDLTIFRAVNC